MCLPNFETSLYQYPEVSAYAPRRGQDLVGPLHPSWKTWSPPTPEPPPNHQAQDRINTHLLPQSHNLEPLKVGQSPPLLSPLPVLRPRALLPLLIDLLFLPRFPQGTRAERTRQFSDHYGRKDDVREGRGMARNGSFVFC